MFIKQSKSSGSFLAFRVSSLHRMFFFKLSSLAWMPWFGCNALPHVPESGCFGLILCLVTISLGETHVPIPNTLVKP